MPKGRIDDQRQPPAEGCGQSEENFAVVVGDRSRDSLVVAVERNLEPTDRSFARSGNLIRSPNPMVDYRGIERLVAQVMELHGCHTAVLYGSWARGDATPASDVDVLYVREGGATVRDARIVDGVYLDAFVYPESAFDTLDPSVLRILGGIAVHERDGFGTALLARVQEMNDRGPPPMPDDQRQALVTWSQKMLDRFRTSRGLEIDYRRMYLAVQGLQDYFALRNAWYPGEKEAFAWLREHDPSTYALFERATQLSDSALADLVAAVYRTNDRAPA